MNRKSKKYTKKKVGILYDSLRLVAGVWAYERVDVCVGYSCV